MTAMRTRRLQDHWRAIALGAAASLVIWLSAVAPAQANTYSFCNASVPQDGVCAQRFIGQAAQIQAHPPDCCQGFWQARAWLIQYYDHPGPGIWRLRTYYNNPPNPVSFMCYAYGNDQFPQYAVGANTGGPVGTIHGCQTLVRMSGASPTRNNYGGLPHAYDPGFIECGAVGNPVAAHVIAGLTDDNARGITIRGSSCDQLVSRVYGQPID